MRDTRIRRFLFRHEGPEAREENPRAFVNFAPFVLDVFERVRRHLSENVTVTVSNTGTATPLSVVGV